MFDLFGLYHQYQEREMVDAFMNSMRQDLHKTVYHTGLGKDVALITDGRFS